MFNLNITTMKNLFSLLCLVVLLGVSANLFAANAGTAIAPAIGDVFKYAVTNHPGNDYAWVVTNTPNIGGTAEAVVSLSGETTNEVTITWVNPTIGALYYVHVTETAASPNSCSNHKVITVVPKNAFTLDFVNTSAAGVDQTVNVVYEVCPPDVDNTIVYTGNAVANTPATTLAEATKFTYTYGTTYLYYHITAAGIATATTDYTVTITPTIPALIANDRSATVSAAFGTMSGSTFTPAGGLGNIATVTTATDFSYLVPNGATSDNLWLRVAVANGTEYEGITANDITLSLTGKDEFNNVVTKVNGITGTSDAEGSKIKARPNSGSITTPVMP